MSSMSSRYFLAAPRTAALSVVLIDSDKKKKSVETDNTSLGRRTARDKKTPALTSRSAKGTGTSGGSRSTSATSATVGGFSFPNGDEDW